MRKFRDIGDTNRTTSRRARSTAFWCDRCDAAFIGNQKCPNCGAKPQQYRNKKLDPVLQETEGDN